LQVKRINLTPQRDAIGNLQGRLAASVFPKVANKGNMVNIGVGFP